MSHRPPIGSGTPDDPELASKPEGSNLLPATRWDFMSSTNSKYRPPPRVCRRGQEQSEPLPVLGRIPELNVLRVEVKDFW
jgi:hypothetical protein